MSEQWNLQNMPEVTPTPAGEPAVEEVVPAREAVPEVTPGPAIPEADPVPPVAPKAPSAYVPPVTPPYATGPYYVPGKVQPKREEQPTRTTSVWVSVLAIFGAVAIVAGIVAGAYLMIRNNAGTGDTGGSFGSTDQTVASNGDHTYNEDAPTLEINTWDTNDGGLSTEEIVNRNYDSTVVLTAYSQSGSFYFGESNLVEAGGSTGIVMTEDGYIITNRHCVVDENTGKAFDRVDVTTYNGTTYEGATIIGVDESTDLAVIKVDATGLSPAQFGDSDELAVGARVVALGNAAGLSWTATQGIVSAKARDVYDDTGYAIKCLQVDLAINYGNSGGPLLNKQGLVVGINSAKIAAAGYEGLGFSIPINEAKVVIDSLMQHGYVKGRVALGITGQTVDSGMYKGFLIASIEKGSCLEGTEAKVNDLIVEIDGVAVSDYGTLRSQLAKHQVGDTVELKLLRSDQRTGQVTSHTVTVTLKEQQAQ